MFVITISALIVLYCRHLQNKEIEEIKSIRASHVPSIRYKQFQGRRAFDDALEDLKSARSSIPLDALKYRFTPFDEICAVGEPFASGYYGQISRVRIADDESYCMKVLKSLNVEKQYEKHVLHDILQEAVNMLQYNHDNVMKMSFISIDPHGLPVLIMPFMENLSLDLHLRTASKTITYKLGLRFMLEAASGMGQGYALRVIINYLLTFNI